MAITLAALLLLVQAMDLLARGRGACPQQKEVQLESHPEDDR